MPGGVIAAVSTVFEALGGAAAVEGVADVAGAEILGDAAGAGLLDAGVGSLAEAGVGALGGVAEGAGAGLLGAAEAGGVAAGIGEGAVLGGAEGVIDAGAGAGLLDSGVGSLAEGAGTALGGAASPVSTAAELGASSGGLNAGSVLTSTPAAPTSVGGAIGGGAPAETASQLGLGDLTQVGSPGLDSGGAVTGTQVAPIDIATPTPVSPNIPATTGFNAPAAPTFETIPENPATSSLGKFIQTPSLATGASAVGANLGSVVSGLGLADQFLTQPKLPSSSAITGQINTTANQLSAQASQLQSYISSGNLPPGAMEAVNSATQSAKASVRSQYASMGLGGSTQEASALSNIDRQASQQIFSIAHSLLTTGINEAGLSAQLYEAILGQTNAQNKELSSAIANFAGAAAGSGTRGVTLNLTGTGNGG